MTNLLPRVMPRLTGQTAAAYAADLRHRAGRFSAADLAGMAPLVQRHHEATLLTADFAESLKPAAA